jgi:hypothetical protein
MEKKKVCPDCDSTDGNLDRRDFLRSVGVTAAAASTVGLPLFATARAVAAPSKNSPAETAVKALYDTLNDDQKKVVCFDWDYVDPDRGLLRTRVSND